LDDFHLKMAQAMSRIWTWLFCCFPNRSTLDYRGISPIRKCSTPQDPPRTLGIGLR
jgi:hypothetical protein